MVNTSVAAAAADDDDNDDDSELVQRSTVVCRRHFQSQNVQNDMSLMKVLCCCRTA